MNEMKSISDRINYEKRAGNFKESQESLKERPLKGIKKGRESITKKKDLARAFEGVRGF